MSPALTVSGLIELLKPDALAGVLDVSVQAISNMKQRGAIPHRHWPAILEISKQKPELKKLTWNDLVAIHTPRAPGGHAEQAARNPRRTSGATA